MKIQQELTDHQSSDSGWNSYWNSAGGQNALSSEGFESLGFKQIWLNFFNSHNTLHDKANILDIACGNGLLTALADYHFKKHSTNSLNFHCVDASSSAISAIKQRFPWAKSLVADAKKMPYEDHQFDLIISHFGIEYAAPLAVTEALRLLKSGGELMFICHYHQGQIYLQCERHFRLMQQFLESGFLTIARDAFVQKIALSQGKIEVSQFDKVDRQLILITKKVKELIQDNKQEPVAQTLNNICIDIDVMFKNIMAYAPQDIFGWFDVTVAELQAYPNRMKAMLSAALDDKGIANLIAQILTAGAEIKLAKPLLSPQDGKRVAWLIQARNV